MAQIAVPESQPTASQTSVALSHSGVVLSATRGLVDASTNAKASRSAIVVRILELIIVALLLKFDQLSSNALSFAGPLLHDHASRCKSNCEDSLTHIAPLKIVRGDEISDLGTQAVNGKGLSHLA